MSLLLIALLVLALALIYGVGMYVMYDGVFNENAEDERAHRHE